MTKSSPSGAEHRVVIGKLGAPHGVSGALRVIPMTDFPERFGALKSVYVDGELLIVKEARYQGRLILVWFEKFPSREEAALLTGKYLSVDRKDAVPLKEGEYYIFDIVGLAVYDEDGNLLGMVSEVLQTGSNDVYVVPRPKEAGGDILIPALKSVVKKIHLDEGKMIVTLPEMMDA